MVGAGALHFAAPAAYDRLVPTWLGEPRFWTLASGVAEVASGALLAWPRTRRAGAWAALVVLVGVFPANVQAALDGGLAGASGLLASPVAAWARLPFQVPLVLWAYRHTR